MWGRVWVYIPIQEWVLVGFLGRVVCMTAGKRKRQNMNRKWWAIARLWGASTLILRSLDFIL